jgi:hypothetical protein
MTIPAITKLLRATVNDERLSQLLPILGVIDADYRSDFQVTTAIGFHLANLTHLIEIGCDTQHIPFICQVLAKLWAEAVKIVQLYPIGDSDELMAWLARRPELPLFGVHGTGSHTTDSPADVSVRGG